MGDFVGVEPGGIDDAASFNGFGFGLLIIANAQAHANSVFDRLQRNHFGVVDEVGAVFLGDASEGMNEVLGGADARGGNLQGGVTLDVRLDGANARRIDDSQALDIIAFTLFLEGEKLLLFGSVLCNDKLPGGATGDIMLRAELLGKAIAFDAETRLQRIFGVVDSGMDDAAIARAGGHPEFGILLDEKNVLPTTRKRFGDRAANNASAYY